MSFSARAIMLAIAALPALASTAEAADARSYAGRGAALELDGKFCALVENAGGGDAYGEVVTLSAGADGIAHKRLAGLRYDDIVFDVDLDDAAACPSLHDWIRDTLRGAKNLRRSGALVELDFQGRERARLLFTNALLTEVGFPGLDGSSKERAALTLRAAPEVARRSKGTGAAVPIGKAKSKQWLQSQFRLSLDGVDTRGVSKIEAFAVKLRFVTAVAGATRDVAKVPTTLDIPNLSLQVSETHVDSFYAWLEDFVVRGNAGQDRERRGTLEWLAPNGGVLGVLRLFQVGVVRVASAPIGANQAARAHVELYVEQMDFGLK
jgi:hypothetical protein